MASTMLIPKELLVNMLNMTKVCKCTYWTFLKKENPRKFEQKWSLSLNENITLNTLNHILSQIF